MPNSTEKYTVQEIIENVREYLANHDGYITRDLYRGYEDAVPEKEWRKLFPTFQALLEASKIDGSPAPLVEEKNTFVADSWNIDLNNTRIHTLDQLLDYCKVDTDIWHVERFIVNKWEVAAKIDNKFEVEPLYQVKAVLTKKKHIIDAKSEIEALKVDLKAGYHPAKNPLLTADVKNGNMLEINIPDSHFGKMAWGAETGDRNYDTSIAAATFERALNTLIEQSTKNFKFEKVLFIVGNDLLNTDNEQGTTTKGTAVSTDGRYQKTFVTVRKAIVNAIHKLKQIAPVQVIMVSGNHDELGVWHLGDSLECAFVDDENVQINNEPKSRKYVRHGKCMLMFTHGDKGKREDYPLLMATEKSQDFGDTKYREVHTGHIHQTKVQEWHGVRVRILPSLSPPDAWHAENSFTGQQRNAEAYVWNAEQGLVAQFYHNDDSYPEIVTDRVLKIIK